MTGEDKAYMLCTRIHTFTHTFISIVYTYISAITYLASSYLTYSCFRIHSHVAVVAAAAVVVVVVVVVVVTAHQHTMVFVVNYRHQKDHSKDSKRLASVTWGSTWCTDNRMRTNVNMWHLSLTFVLSRLLRVLMPTLIYAPPTDRPPQVEPCYSERWQPGAGMR